MPREEFRSVLATIIRRGEHHRGGFEHFRPGFNLGTAQAERLAEGDEPGFRPEDLFPDVRPCFAALRAAGVRIGVAGNTSVLTEHAVRAAGLGQEFIASSSRWRAAKPEPAFYRYLADACSVPPEAIAYVGDRLDNDAIPAVRAGMTGIWLRRGLWADAQRDWPEAGQATAIDGLDALSELLQRGSI